MYVFSNKYDATIDDKGRVVLPSAFKKEMGDAFESVFAVEIDPHEKCFNLYPESQWEKRIQFVRSRLNPNDRMQARVLDKFYQNFVKINVAENRRLNIPNAFLKRLGVDKDVVFTGQDNKIRMWNAESYYQSIISDEDYSAVFNDVMGGGFNEM